ncbi:hypothetical protein [Haloarcula japonica]|uniref:Uncharacterized protein n=1 Tax=Haloarcula japonica (strain ATCC 49778 / DSM 6131 / JCM 7785 / NBRC 101032 / NCIMB 13157 / TR-1) TaxID=1227453 RepID=M0LBH5_HALJT|nr:hypothetical protein [Haloarcula japonica]EMA30926.1 hypothetical protein C444_09030 [Haloarcula japonica DSM 6131]
MQIQTTEIDPDSLSTHKNVKIQEKEFDTPAKALQVGKLRGSEDVSPLARGVVEIYKRANAVALRNSRDGWTGLADGLKSQAKSAEDDEVVIPFIGYRDTATLTKENAREIAKLQTNYGDLLTVPLMKPLVDGADNGDGRTEPEVASIIENTENYLEAVDELKIQKPVMGVLPPISEDCTKALIDLYMDHGLRAYCIDFSRRSPMAKSQLDNVMNPMLQTLTEYNIREDSLTYAVNANDSRPVSDGRRTADSMYAYTIGIDIVGDNHISPNWPEEVFEEMGGGEVKLRLFDGETVSVVDVPVSNLQSFLPDEAEIDVDRVKGRISADPDEQYRFEKIINTELISLYLDSEGGVDPDEIFVDLLTGNFTQESDIERVRNLVEEIKGE